MENICGTYFRFSSLRFVIYSEITRTGGSVKVSLVMGCGRVCLAGKREKPEEVDATRGNGVQEWQLQGPVQSRVAGRQGARVCP